MNNPVIEIFGRRVQLIDLSRPLEPTASEPNPPQIEQITHQDCAAMWQSLFDIPATALPGGIGFAGEIVQASTHASTHVDAPWHYAPTSEGEPAWTIDQIPLDWFIGKAIILDVSDLAAGHLIKPREIAERLQRLNYRINGESIVLFHTGADPFWGKEEFFCYGCGLGAEAVLFLTDQGVRIVGTDAWSLDRPYPTIADEWATHQDPSRLWPAHFVGRQRKFLQIEKLT
ncbi:MAG TPA: cyclase family protein, partial [Candidatus Binatus sp.]|nr:cyclase family protein [Candidatus Binatus sp.]